jgi:hypothetical protein
MTPGPRAPKHGLATGPNLRRRRKALPWLAVYRTNFRQRKALYRLAVHRTNFRRRKTLPRLTKTSARSTFPFSRVLLCSVSPPLDDGHEDVHELRSASFENWLIMNYLQRQNPAPGGGRLKSLIRTFEAEAARRGSIEIFTCPRSLIGRGNERGHTGRSSTPIALACWARF